MSKDKSDVRGRTTIFMIKRRLQYQTSDDMLQYALSLPVPTDKVQRELCLEYQALVRSEIKRRKEAIVGQDQNFE